MESAKITFSFAGKIIASINTSLIMANKGKIAQVIGPVVDVSFEAEGATVPDILDALEVVKPNGQKVVPVSYTHLRAHETRSNLVCRLLLEKKK